MVDPVSIWPEPELKKVERSTGTGTKTRHLVAHWTYANFEINDFIRYSIFISVFLNSISRQIWFIRLDEKIQVCNIRKIVGRKKANILRKYQDIHVSLKRSITNLAKLGYVMFSAVGLT